MWSWKRVKAFSRVLAIASRAAYVQRLTENYFALREIILKMYVISFVPVQVPPLD
jgi:hypothetical protein